MIVYLWSFLIVLCLGLILFINRYPSFGGSPSKKAKENYQGLHNYLAGKFVNLVPTKMDMGATNLFSMLKEYLFEGKDLNPAGPIPVTQINWNKIKSGEDSITWLGHSAFLISIDNKKLLTDPMLGPIASPVSFAGSKRYNYSEDMQDIINEMPPIDAVFITHDHYDHLDYPSILKLKNKTAHFFVPLGVSAHLIRWGVAKDKITELNWWNEAEFQGLTVALAPTKHFSGRGIFNRDSTLWGGWVILGRRTRFYTSGDGGYDEHFKEIGKKYGPFDITLLEGGQYDRRWSWVHMTPEQAVQAHRDLNGKTMMLMHWGGFTLAFHSWNDPIERAILEAQKAGVNLIAPKIGETLFLNSDQYNPPSSWWEL
ncbi:putative Zn-dependent hydrolase of beta-lactamase fold protein [Desulfosporosinus orientis DSM 765]|uniref:Putative Zn-dependent hydrolase of beta-lactamase fold protein n=1 Tax=Desulfosporosinus orientis (strain ATCC 19365 / DSM 765 / NCIMB 8382 / VKM B-1628 / Singapore I) TaxID=768706 RepID=G7W6Q2_DESOD|nr:MBL fold metallo-hydrolase [Desulfosporosinus orientis]AET69184.1 putative Zn-dependent hydrolase of beta-lactamase fold protein [Desulfosporosinus orientis DSM 765]